MIGRPKYGVIGMYVLPWFLLFEFFGSLLELTGIGIVILAALFEVVSIVFLVVFSFVCLLFWLVLSFAAIILEEYAIRRYTRGSDMARLVGYSLVESVGYRQLNCVLALPGDGRSRARAQGLGCDAAEGARAPRRAGATGSRDPRWLSGSSSVLPSPPSWRASPSSAAGAGSSEGDVWLEPRKSGDLMLPARVEGRSIAAATADGYAPIFWPGVNLGPTTPGHSPGEVAATREEYDRWLKGMGDLGVRVVRIYTILRPAFYDALGDYNDDHDDAPIMLIHGVWIPEEEFYETENAYSKAVTEGFRAEIKDAVDVVHGDADIPELPGHAGGKYTHRRVALAARLLDRRRMGPVRGPVDRRQERRQEPVQGQVHPRHQQGDADGELARLDARLHRRARRQAWMEPAPDLHELADRRPARTP